MQCNVHHVTLPAFLNSDPLNTSTHHNASTRRYSDRLPLNLSCSYGRFSPSLRKPYIVPISNFDLHFNDFWSSWISLTVFVEIEGAPCALSPPTLAFERQTQWERCTQGDTNVFSAWRRNSVNKGLMVYPYSTCGKLRVTPRYSYCSAFQTKRVRTLEDQFLCIRRYSSDLPKFRFQLSHRRIWVRNLHMVLRWAWQMGRGRGHRGMNQEKYTYMYYNLFPSRLAFFCAYTYMNYKQG